MYIVYLYGKKGRCYHTMWYIEQILFITQIDHFIATDLGTFWIKKINVKKYSNYKANDFNLLDYEATKPIFTIFRGGGSKT